jgi:hypothetical protein
MKEAQEIGHEHIFLQFTGQLCCSTDARHLRCRTQHGHIRKESDTNFVIALSMVVKDKGKYQPDLTLYFI